MPPRGSRRTITSPTDGSLRTVLATLASARFFVAAGEEDLLVPLEHPETAQPRTTAARIPAGAFTR
jgi:hypothetical protein